MTQIEIILSITLGLLVNECSDVSPWCARNLMRLSARLRYLDPERCRTRSEELVALVDERPGKLLKLFTGVGFLLSALLTLLRRRVDLQLRRITRRAARHRPPAGFAPGNLLVGSDLKDLPRAAEQVRAAIRGLDASAGAVISVRGPWGSGKSSVVNMALSGLTQARIVEFNPWLSWNQQYCEHAAAELPNVLRASSRQLRRVAAALAPFLEQHSTTRLVHRRRVKRTLRALPEPLIVVLDDIDRLPADKVREVFDLVEKTASLPKLIYVMSFDRGHVESIVVGQRTTTSKTRRLVQQSAIDLTCTHRRLPGSGPPAA
jgi:Cdc6-like AAA superfamily ATPase